MECLSRPIFWELAISIPAFWLFSALQTTPENADDGPNAKARIRSNVQLRTNATRWIRPHITSRFRKVVVISAYLVILLLQLLEGKWALQAVGELTETYFNQFPAFYSTPLWVYLVLFVYGAVLRLSGLLLWAAGFLIVGLQLVCLVKLAALEIG